MLSTFCRITGRRRSFSFSASIQQRVVADLRLFFLHAAEALLQDPAAFFKKLLFGALDAVAQRPAA